MERPAGRRTEMSHQQSTPTCQPQKLIALMEDPPASVKPSDHCCPSWHLTMWEHSNKNSPTMLFWNAYLPEIVTDKYLACFKVSYFPLVMYGCESWTIKKAECQRIDAFELWCWRRLLRVPWTARRSDQSILKEIRPGCSLEGLMLKLKLWYFGHLTRRVDLLEKTLMLGKIEGRRRRGRQRMRCLDGITNSMDMGLGRL